MSSKGHFSTGLLRRVHVLFGLLVLFYVLAVLLVMTPLIQTSVLYANHIDFFGYNDFTHPESYGLAPGKTVNLNLQSSDNTTIGAWYMFSDRFYRELPFPPNVTRESFVPPAAKSNPTILYLHGNTGTRALHLRVALYTAFTSRLNSNVLAIDYRGFGDSEGHPTLDGVARDARAGWDYLIKQGTRPEDITIFGHSLGTAVAGLLSAELGRENINPRGLVLTAPFSSVRTLMDQYYLFGFLPLLKPLTVIPFAPRMITWSLVDKFDTLSLVPEIKCSVLIAHARDDFDIQHSHSSDLFNGFVDSHIGLPVVPGRFNTSSWDETSSQRAILTEHPTKLVSHIDIYNFGAFHEFVADGRKVVLLKTLDGGHDIPKVEGVQDAVGRMFNLF